MNFNLFFMVFLVLLLVVGMAFFIDKNGDDSVDVKVDSRRVVYVNVLSTDIVSCDGIGMIYHNSTHCKQF